MASFSKPLHRLALELVAMSLRSSLQLSRALQFLKLRAEEVYKFTCWRVNRDLLDMRPLIQSLVMNHSILIRCIFLLWNHLFQNKLEYLILSLSVLKCSISRCWIYNRPSFEVAESGCHSSSLRASHFVCHGTMEASDGSMSFTLALQILCLLISRLLAIECFGGTSSTLFHQTLAEGRCSGMHSTRKILAVLILQTRQSTRLGRNCTNDEAI